MDGTQLATLEVGDQRLFLPLHDISANALDLQLQKLDTITAVKCHTEFLPPPLNKLSAWMSSSKGKDWGCQTDTVDSRPDKLFTQDK